MLHALLSALIFVLVPVQTHARVPSLAVTFETNIEIINLTKDQEAKVRLAEDRLKKVVASEEFKKRMLSHYYKGVKTYVDNMGLSNLEIYNKILEGAEVLTPEKNNRMDIGVKTYYADDSSIGYTTRGITYINVNTKYFDTLSVEAIAGNMMHEWLHKLGFEHSRYRVPGRNFTVPYAIGRMISELAAHYK